MVFSSPPFLLVFLPLTLLGYFLIPAKRIKIRNLLLLLCSLVFFAWSSPRHILLILASMLINYMTGLLVGRFREKPLCKKLAFTAGVLLNLGLLFYFKYLGFALANAKALFGLNISIPDIVLPIGISFFTFQGMSYMIDAYRGEVEVNKNILDFMLYIALFPQLIAGPIVNYKDIVNQLDDHPVNIEAFAAGIERFIVGLSKKLLIADVLGAQASALINALEPGIDAPSAWLAVICYTFQIYFDFSAYSDMAIGLARMFGFSLLENFNYPYIATSVTDFWRRWHISLSTWFRDYLYIPLGGNRRGNTYLNLFIVFCATGLWHGAQWQFLLWGLWHGLFLMVERFMIKKGVLDKIPAVIRRFTTFFIVIMGWVLFSANGLNGALDMVKTMFGFRRAGFVDFSFIYYLNAKTVVTLALAAVGSTRLVADISERFRASLPFSIVKRTALLALLALCMITAVSGTYSPFIYFRF